MVVRNLENLVLCGVSVLRDGSAGNLRRGTSAVDKTKGPGNCLTMRHPSPDYPQAYQPAGRLEQAVLDSLADAGVGGAGRLPSAGVSVVTCSQSRIPPFTWLGAQTVQDKRSAMPAMLAVALNDKRLHLAGSTRSK
jgi:hypothetical protein